jgi:hypothetical protein
MLSRTMTARRTVLYCGSTAGWGARIMDSDSIRGDALYLLALAAQEPDASRAQHLRYRASVLQAQADHLETTGHYIELPGYIGSSTQRDAAA